MSITIELPSALESRVEDRAEEAGVTVPEYIIRILEGTVSDDLSRKTFAQIFAPLKGGFEESGMSEDELNLFVEKEVKAYRAEKRASQA